MEKFKEVWHTTPFRPFTLHMADGREIAVKHPDFVSISPNGRTVIVQQLDESFSIIDLLLVTGIEVKKGSRQAGRRLPRNRGAQRGGRSGDESRKPAKESAQCRS